MNRRASIGIALLALSHLAFANGSSALAQAGSTGGTIGKTDKSISGGEAAPETQTRTKSRSKGQRPIDQGNADQPLGVSFSGRWAWSAECSSGHWQGEFNLAPTSRGNFNGSFGSTLLGTIADGHINGASLAFTRKIPFVTQYWKGQLAGGRIKGTLSGNENCSWEAVRK
jgi:hypothetical protein